jgi:arylsulfatase A-like enzyme
VFRSLAVALAAAALLAAGCADRPAERPNIVLVVLDTVRSDVAEPDDQGVVEAMPELGSLGREGTVFTNAWATAPWTLPSHASILTGLLPSGHGCTARAPMLARAHRTIGDHLHESGYETVAFYSNPWLTGGMSGMMKGFESHYVESRGDDRIHRYRGSQGGAASNENIAQWLDSRSEEKPFLLFVNYLEAHLPYDPHPEVRSEWLPDMPEDRVVGTLWAYEFNAGLHDFDEVDWRGVRRLYQGDATTADALLGDLMDMLRDKGLYEDTVIIVTSDHGENLGDHGLMDHHFGVFETLIKVPLVIRAPGRMPGGLREDPVMLVDLFPTILQTAGIGELPELPHARSLLGPPAEPDRPLIAEYAGGNASLVEELRTLNPDLDIRPLTTAYSTVRVENFRLTEGSDGSHLLEDLSGATGGSVDLEVEGQAIAAELEEHLPPIGAPAGKIKIDDEMREELRALGYVQ